MLEFYLLMFHHFQAWVERSLQVPGPEVSPQLSRRKLLMICSENIPQAAAIKVQIFTINSKHKIPLINHQQKWSNQEHQQPVAKIIQEKDQKHQSNNQIPPRSPPSHQEK